MKSIFSAALLFAAGFAIKLNQQPTDDEIAVKQDEIDQMKKDGMTDDQIWAEAVDEYCIYSNCDDLDSQDEELIQKHLEKIYDG